jgi:hypothetical protein
MQKYRGSLLGRSSALKCNWDARMINSGGTIFIAPIPCSRCLFSGDTFGCQGKKFLPILHEVRDCDDYFHLKKDATGKLGITSCHICNAALLMFAHRVVQDCVDEYMCMSESICLVSMYKFCIAMVVFTRILERTKCFWHCPAIVNQRVKGIS